MQKIYNFFAIFLVVLEVNCIELFRTPKVPRFEHEWWGPAHLKCSNDTSIKPFQVHFSNEMILDLRYRLKNTRSCTPPLEGVNFEYGFNTDHLQGWLDYWADHYPFQHQEAYLNQYPQFKTNIQGLDIHFLWVKPHVPLTVETIPLLLLHGWPGSVREFYETLPMLTAVSADRDFALEVIAPSLPGFGFSDPAVRPGMGPSEIAVVLRNLMHRLGFKKYYVQGGDWGAVVGQDMATIYPKEVLGYHTNLAVSFAPASLALWLLGSAFPPLVVEPELADRMYPILGHVYWLVRETGYFHEQATKPQDSILSSSLSSSTAYMWPLLIKGIFLHGK